MSSSIIPRRLGHSSSNNEFQTLGSCTCHSWMVSVESRPPEMEDGDPHDFSPQMEDEVTLVLSVGLLGVAGMMVNIC